MEQLVEVVVGLVEKVVVGPVLPCPGVWRSPSTRREGKLQPQSFSSPPVSEGPASPQNPHFLLLVGGTLWEPHDDSGPTADLRDDVDETVV